MNTMICQMTTIRTPRKILATKHCEEHFLWVGGRVIYGHCDEGAEVWFPAPYWCDTKPVEWCYPEPPKYGVALEYATFLVLEGQADPRHPSWTKAGLDHIASEVLSISGLLTMRYPTESSQVQALHWAREHTWKI